MEITKLINDVLSTFTTYIVDNAADPGYMPQLKKYLEGVCKGAADIDEILTHMEQLAGEIAAISAETKDYLSVYSSDPMESYSGGVALIAAQDYDEACKLRDGLCDSFSNYDEPKLVKGLRYIGDSEVIFDATYRE